MSQTCACMSVSTKWTRVNNQVDLFHYGTLQPKQQLAGAHEADRLFKTTSRGRQVAIELLRSFRTSAPVLGRPSAPVRQSDESAPARHKQLALTLVLTRQPGGMQSTEPGCAHPAMRRCIRAGRRLPPLRTPRKRCACCAGCRSSAAESVLRNPHKTSSHRRLREDKSHMQPSASLEKYRNFRRIPLDQDIM